MMRKTQPRAQLWEWYRLFTMNVSMATAKKCNLRALRQIRKTVGGVIQGVRGNCGYTVRN